jgi:large subunit ribosomal protein L17
MQHKVKGRKLGRVRKQRKALLKTLIGSFVMREKIKTTEAKAKEIAPFVDRIIHKAKKTKSGEKNKVTTMRELQKIMPAMAVKKISGVFLDKFEKRNSGYTRIIKTGRRKSDGAKMAVIEFV